MPRRHLFVAAVATAALSVAACGVSSGGKDDASGGSCSSVKLAYMGPLTGSSATFGKTAVNATKIAISDFEAAHPKCKIGGLATYDSQGDPGQAPALAQKVVAQQNVVGLIGPGFSGETEAAEPIFDSAGLPTITSSSTEADLAKKGWKVFHRTVGNDAVEAPGIAKYVVQTMHAKTIAVIDNGQAYGKGSATLFKPAAQKLGARIVLNDTIDANAQDDSSTAISVASKKPAAVYCGCLYPEAGRLLKQLRSAGSKALFFGPAGVYSPDFVKDAGSEAAQGAYVGAASAPIGHFSGYSKFAAEWKKRFGGTPDVYSPEAYDAATAFLNAIAAGNTTRSSINTYLGKKCDFKGLSGQIKFAANGNVEHAEVSIYQVKSGQLTFLTRVPSTES